MSEQIAQQDEVEADLKQGKIRVRGSDMLGILTVVGIFVFGYILWDHRVSSHEGNQLIASAIKEMTVAQKESVVVQRVTNCLMSIDQKDRESRLPICERIAR